MSVAIVAAHPDDEVIGLGTVLATLRDLVVIHVTDGAPRSGADGANAGCSTWQEYAALRREEFTRALEIAGVKGATTICLECPDQQASFRIARHAMSLAKLLSRLRPSFVFTHAYEGGHPDHDATAAAVHAAFRIAEIPAPLLEFAGYHAGDAGFECECFVDAETKTWERLLADEERHRKRELFDCYKSQSRVLAQFPLRNEPLRLAPAYDFSGCPHGGRLYYEQFDWGVDGHEWRRLAVNAFHDLDLPCVC